jgi:hypothetical protein
MAGYGSIGSFYFGDGISAEIILEPLNIQFVSYDGKLGSESIKGYRNLNVMFRILEPNVFISNDIDIDFSASPRSGRSPLEVEFEALPLTANNFNREILEYRWTFDYDNDPSTIEVTTNPIISHTYTGNDGDTFSVRLEIIITDNEREIYELKTDYIIIEKSPERYGFGKKINLREFVPQFLRGSDTFYLVKMFEDYLNEMYYGEEGNIITTELVDGVEEISIQTYKSIQISVLEKIYRLPELHDPDLMDIDKIQYFANNLGYNVNVNKSQFGVVGGNADDVDKYLRFMVSNLPNWYKIKSTRNSIKSMLFSFGLIGDIVYYYTKDYDEDNNNWIYGNVYFDQTENKLKEDLSKINNSWYPTPHFSVWYDINKSNTNFSYDTTKQKQIYNAIDSVRPVNTVFKGIIGNWQTLKHMGVATVHKVSKFVRINHNDGDYWV